MDLATAIQINSQASQNNSDSDILNWLNRFFLLACLELSPEKQITFRASIRQRGQSILWSLAKKLPVTETLLKAITTGMAKLEGNNAEEIKTYHRTLINSEEVNVTGIHVDKFDTVQFLRNMDKAGHPAFRTSLESAVLGEVGTEGVTHFNLVMGINAKGYPTVLGFQAEATETTEVLEDGKGNSIAQPDGEDLPF